MAISVTNIQPTELNNSYLGSLAGAFDPYDEVKNTIIAPLFKPLIASAPALIEENGKPIDEDDITSTLFSCCDDKVNVTAEQKMKDIFNQTLAYYDKSLSVRNIYQTQVAKKNGMPLPSSKVIYVETDVIDTAKELLNGQTNRDVFFATVAFYAHCETFGYYFANDAAFSDFKAWFANEINIISNQLTQETLNLCNDFQKIRLNYLTQSFVLRDDTSQNNDPYSFARILPFYLMMYEKYVISNNMPECVAGHMPFTFDDNICPRTVVIMNVEKHAHAHPAQIKAEWNTINSALAMRPKVLGLNKIAKLTAATRNAQRMSAQADGAKSGAAARSAMIRFRKTPPTSFDLANYVLAIFKRCSNIQTSENMQKCFKMTYQRPSRREPDNPDRQGKSSFHKFKPDLHLYIDCSGSISERDYQDAIKTCIKLAQRLNINFYFNSFSHIMSASKKLHVKDRTLKEIYEEFRNTPKVDGGTDYEQIWHYINRSDKRSKEISIIISDFEYWAPNHYVKHPRFLYYAPISTANWSGIVRSAESFAKTMLNICPDVRKHILM